MGGWCGPGVDRVYLAHHTNGVSHSALPPLTKYGVWRLAWTVWTVWTAFTLLTIRSAFRILGAFPQSRSPITDSCPSPQERRDITSVHGGNISRRLQG